MQKKLSIHLTAKIINLWLIVLSSVIYITPYLKRGVPKIGWIVLLVLWYLNVLISPKRNGNFIGTNILYTFILWILFVLMYKFLNVSTAEIGNYLLLICSLDMIVKAMYVQQYYSINEKRKLFGILAFVIVFNVSYNLFVFLTKPSAFVSTYFYESAYNGTNLVSEASFYHLVAFFSAISLYLAFREKGMKKYLSSISVVICVVFLTLVQPRMNALIILLLSFAITLFHYGKTKNKSGRALVILIIALLVATIFGNNIIGLLPDRLQVRLTSIINIFTNRNGYEENLGSLNSRIQLQLVSLRTFFSSFTNFVFGAGMHLGSSYNQIIGQHSFITNQLAAYGLFGVFFCLYLFGIAFKRYLRQYNDIFHQSYVAKIIYIFEILLLISDGFNAGTICVVFLLTSCIERYDSEQLSIT